MGRKKKQNGDTGKKLLKELALTLGQIAAAGTGVPSWLAMLAKAILGELLKLPEMDKARQVAATARLAGIKADRLYGLFTTLEVAILKAADMLPDSADRLAQAVDDITGGREQRLEQAVEHLFPGGPPPTDPRELAALVPVVWPDHRIRPGSQVIAEPFVGRTKELRQLTAAFWAPRSVICVVGMAGQGKSALVAEWYRRNHRKLKDRAVFWCRPYETGYTFAAFLADVLAYTAGDQYDPAKHKTTEAQAELLCEVLRRRPTAVILDGLERWLSLWRGDLDATGEGATADDRAGGTPGLDFLLRDAAAWTNGSALVLTSRALPSALDDRKKVTIGAAGPGPQKTLAGLDDPAAVKLMRELGVNGDRKGLLEAARVYDNHALTVRVLSGLLADWYGGDVTKHEEVRPPRDDPRKEGLPHLLGKIADRRADHLPLLTHVACCVGPAAVEMLAELLAEPEQLIRRRLGDLTKWQLARFDGRFADAHALIRQYALARAETDNAGRTVEIRLAIAGWFEERPLPDQPQTIDEVSPLIRATEHALAAGDVRLATHFLYGTRVGRHYATLSHWLSAFGHLARSVELHSEVVEHDERLVHLEGRRELRSDLASAYNNRGNALRLQGKLDAAVADYGKAIETYRTLVEAEGRRELRNDLARAYSDRGLALQLQGKLDAAVADYGRVIEVRSTLVEAEGRRELRNDLASTYNNRGNALHRQGRPDAAVADYGKAIEISETLVEAEGRRELAADLEKPLFNRALVRRAGGMVGVVGLMVGAVVCGRGRNHAVAPRVAAAKAADHGTRPQTTAPGWLNEK